MMAAWLWWVPESFKQSVKNEIASTCSSFRKSATGTVKSVKEEIASYREHDASEDISNHPKAETDSTARDLRRQGKEDVNIQFYEETWYLNKEEIKEYIEDAKRLIKE